MRNAGLASVMIAAGLAAVGGCSTAPKSVAGKASLHEEVIATISLAKREDPGLKRFFDDSHGYAIFPTVGKGGMGIGGAYGKGELFEQGAMIGYCDLSQATIGFQLGGQAYSELIFFKHKPALDEFMTGNFAFSAQASAVALTSGVSADADYEGGVAVFTMAKGGLMYEASIGGQKFSFVPK